MAAPWWGWLPVLSLLLMACGLRPDGTPQGERPGWASPTSAPALAGAGLDGERLDISAYRGHVVVIDFWASWCVACRAEQPELNAIATTYGSRGVRLLGDDMREVLPSARSYVGEFGVRYPNLIDPTSDMAAAYGVAAPPTTIVVDEAGRIVGRYLGTLTGVTQQLDALLVPR